MAAGVEPTHAESGVGVRRAAVPREFCCAGCGYAVSVAGEPPPCPMCCGDVWDPAPWRPFTALAAIVGLDARSTSERPP